MSLVVLRPFVLFQSGLTTQSVSLVESILNDLINANRALSHFFEKLKKNNKSKKDSLSLRIRIRTVLLSQIRRLFGCEQLLARQRRKGFLHRIVIGDEKWVHCDNPKRRKSWGYPSQASTSTAEPYIHGPNNHRRSLSNAIIAFESSIERQTAATQRET